jgi:hypothetical protein
MYVLMEVDMDVDLFVDVDMVMDTDMDTKSQHTGVSMTRKNLVRHRYFYC